MCRSILIHSSSAGMAQCADWHSTNQLDRSRGEQANWNLRPAIFYLPSSILASLPARVVKWQPRARFTAVYLCKIPGSADRPEVGRTWDRVEAMLESAVHLEQAAPNTGSS